jgi:hypothetical protein
MQGNHMNKVDGSLPEIERYDASPEIWSVRQMFEALERRDDASLWEAARRAPSQAQFFEDLRHQVSSTSYVAGTRNAKSRKVPSHCSLVFVPVILGKALQDVIDNDEALKPATRQIHGWLGEWFEHNVEVSMLNTLVGYDEVCIWSPSIMRERLERLAVGKKPSIPVPPNFNFHLPSEAPELAFIVAAIHRPLEWPRLPADDATENRILAAKLSGALQVCSQSPAPGMVEVLVPDFASDALCAGILRWVESIAETVGIKRWDAQMVDQDLVVLHLELGEDAATTTPIPLRAHQLGLSGLEEILKRVSELGTGCFTKSQ